MEKEKCVICSKVTPYEKTTHVDMRSFYVEGCGQLCQACYERVYIKEANDIKRKAQLLLD